MQRVSERRRRVGTVVSYFSEYFPRTSSNASLFRPGSIRFFLFLRFYFARVFPSGDTDARPVCRPNPFPLGTPSPHRGTHRRGVTRLLCSYLGAITPGAESATAWVGGPGGLRLSSCRFARPTCTRGTRASDTLPSGGLRRFFRGGHSHFVFPHSSIKRAHSCVSFDFRY